MHTTRAYIARLAWTEVQLDEIGILNLHPGGDKQWEQTGPGGAQLRSGRNESHVRTPYLTNLIGVIDDPGRDQRLRSLLQALRPLVLGKGQTSSWGYRLHGMR
jgi:hypothetical protein